MAIIKAPPKQPKSVTIQARVEESLKTQLYQYAKFIESTPSYVITEALKVLFKRDDEFKAWVEQHANGQSREKVQREAARKNRITNMRTRLTQFGARENTASSRQHAPRLAEIPRPPRQIPFYEACITETHREPSVHHEGGPGRTHCQAAGRGHRGERGARINDESPAPETAHFSRQGTRVRAARGVRGGCRVARQHPCENAPALRPTGKRSGLSNRGSLVFPHNRAGRMAALSYKFKLPIRPLELGESRANVQADALSAGLCSTRTT